MSPWSSRAPREGHGLRKCKVSFGSRCAGQETFPSPFPKLLRLNRMKSSVGIETVQEAQPRFCCGVGWAAGAGARGQGRPRPRRGPLRRVRGAAGHQRAPAPRETSLKGHRGWDGMGKVKPAWPNVLRDLGWMFNSHVSKKHFQASLRKRPAAVPSSSGCLRAHT